MSKFGRSSCVRDSPIDEKLFSSVPCVKFPTRTVHFYHMFGPGEGRLIQPGEILCTRSNYQNVPGSPVNKPPKECFMLGDLSISRALRRKQNVETGIIQAPDSGATTKDVPSSKSSNKTLYARFARRVSKALFRVRKAFLRICNMRTHDFEDKK